MPMPMVLEFAIEIERKEVSVFFFFFKYIITMPLWVPRNGPRPYQPQSPPI